MRFPIVKGPLGCKRLRQGDVLPDIAEVSEVRVRHARTSLTAFHPYRGTPHSRARVFGNVPRANRRGTRLPFGDGGKLGKLVGRPWKGATGAAPLGSLGPDRHCPLRRIQVVLRPGGAGPPRVERDRRAARRTRGIGQASAASTKRALQNVG